MSARIRFDGGTVVLEDAPDHVRPDAFVYDARIGHWRAKAIHYAEAVLRMHRAKVPYVDEARSYEVLDRRLGDVPFLQGTALARNAARAALKADPEWAPAYNQLAFIELARYGKLEEAYPYYLKAIEFTGERPGRWLRGPARPDRVR